jgi:Domain of unknown function (DUF4328)
MGTADMWICGDCRSANNARDKRCYRCSVPRATAELTEASAANAFAVAQQTTTVLAAATRLGVHYRTTWPLAILTGALILASTAIDVVWTRSYLQILQPDGTVVLDPAHAQSMQLLSYAYLACFLVSGLGWSLWIALVVANVPALTARWPSRTPAGAFFAPWIPFINLKRPYSVAKEVTTILSRAAVGPAIVVIAWWIAFLSWRYGPIVVVFLRALGGDDQSLGGLTTTGSWAGLIFEIIAAILAASVLVTVEYHQRMALDRRSEAVLGPRPGAA